MKVVELTFIMGSEMVKFRVTSDKQVLAASARTGFRFIPHTFMEEGINVFKDKGKKINEREEEEFNKDLEYLEKNRVKDIVKELIREGAKGGMRLLKEEKKDVENIFNENS